MPKILVVDDEADMRFAVRMLLERSGYSVVEADNGDAALAKIREGAPDLVLLDMRLPGMDGIQILQKIRENQKNLPIIMVTGYGNVELAKHAMQLGADHYLSKPFHNKELIDVISQILKKRGYVLPERPVASAPAAAARYPTGQGTPYGRARWATVGIVALAMIWHFASARSQYPIPYSNPAGMAFNNGSLWVADWFSQAIYVHEVQNRDLPIKKTYYLPDIHLTGLAVTSNAVYTADAWAHVLRKHRLDDRLSILSTVKSPGPSPCSLYWDGKYLWSCDLSTGKIYQHQADDRLTVVATYASPGQTPVGFFKNERYGWSLDAKTRKLYERRLDDQLSIVKAYALPEWEEGVSPVSGFTWRNDDLWFTRTGKSFVYRRSKKKLHEVKL